MVVFLFAPFSHSCATSGMPRTIPGNRVVSVYISQDFLNEQLKGHIKSDIFKALKIVLDSNNDQIYLRGTIQVPIEELRAVNLDSKFGAFYFQATIKLATTKEGHLILEFPLSETYFYALDSKDPERERVIVPVQMLSVALASARGYLSALSGDFSGFDRQTKKLEALLKAAERSIRMEQNPEALEELKTQKESLRLKLAAVPIERKQLQSLSKELEHLLGFTGEKELNLNDELAAHKNSIVFKIRLSQLTPYLTGVDLGGVRIIHDKIDGGGENYFVVDINSDLAVPMPPPTTVVPRDRAGMKIAPSLIVRLNQSIFDSQMLVKQEKEEMSDKIREFSLQLKDDGLHVEGKYHTFFFNLPFKTVVDFASSGVDEFEVKIRALEVAGIDFGFLEDTILKSVKRRLNVALKGICKFKHLGEENEKIHGLRVIVDSKALVPLGTDLHLVAVDVRDGEFLMKLGIAEPEKQKQASK